MLGLATYAGRAMVHSSIIPTPTSRTRPWIRRVGRATRCITKRTTRACSGSRRGGIRAMCSGMRCPFRWD